MRRETRVNVIFLTVFILFALPGAVILFRKKLDPTAHRLDQPDPVLHRLPYMSPLPAPPDIKWIVPDRTQAWVQSLTAPAPVLSAAPPGPEWEPVISGDHLVQVLSITSRPEGLRLTILLWTEPASAGIEKVTAKIDDGSAKTYVVDVQSVALPAGVRHELVMGGFVRPPRNVLLCHVNVDGLAQSSTHRLEIDKDTGYPIRTSLIFRPAPAEH